MFLRNKPGYSFSLPIRDNQSMSTIGTRVRSLRISFGITQKRLADALGISQAAISQIERDHTVSLSGSVLAGLCKELRTTPEFILGHITTNQGFEDAMSESELVKIFRDLPIEARRYLQATARGLLTEYGEHGANNPYPRTTNRRKFQ